MTGWVARAADGASEEQLARLQAVCPIPLPAAYRALLKESNGAEAGLSVDPLWLVVHDSDAVVEVATTGSFRSHFPGYFLFGGSGGGDAFAFATGGDAPGAVVAIDLTDAELTQSVRPVADSFDALLALIDT